MLKCRDVAERASDYADAALPWHGRMAVRLHMAMCGPCRRYINQMLKTIGLVAAIQAGEADPATSAQMADKLAKLRRTGSTGGSH